MTMQHMTTTSVDLVSSESKGQSSAAARPEGGTFHLSTVKPGPLLPWQHLQWEGGGAGLVGQL